MCPAKSADIAVIGLGVMGRNLALNLADHGFAVVASDPFPEVVAQARGELEPRVRVVPTPRDAALGPDRATRFLVMIKAGDPVDALLAELAPVLRPGDIVVDGGNSHWRDTERRRAASAANGVRFVGLGISGGREGARHGASLMAGGEAEALAELAPILAALAAPAPDGQPCYAAFGPGGAGHFVKMAHNGIEYAMMQIFAEIALALLGPAGLSPKQAAARLRAWVDGPAASYLLDITAIVLDAVDVDTGRPLIDVIADRAAHKGTGKWAVEAAAELGVAVPSIAAAYFARILSSTRVPVASGEARGAVAEVEALVADLAEALPLAMLASYLQGLELIAAAARAGDWKTDLAAAAKVWRAGCIIRADLLNPLAEALSGAGRPLAVLDGALAARLAARGLPALRRVATVLLAREIPAPALLSVVAYLDGVAAPRLGAAIIQGQRDFFGDHSFERVDRPGAFHHPWPGKDEA